MAFVCVCVCVCVNAFLYVAREGGPSFISSAAKQNEGGNSNSSEEDTSRDADVPSVLGDAADSPARRRAGSSAHHCMHAFAI